MKLGALRVENLLSFDQFDLSFDGALTVLVGPNGSGKTNVIRVLDLVTKALDWVDARWAEGTAGNAAQLLLDSYAEARYYDAAPDQPARVHLDVEFTSPQERELMTAFLQAALLSTVLSELAGGEPPAELVAWAATATEEELSSLYSGTIVLEHSGVAQATWDVAYEFCHDHVSYRWVLAGAPTWGGIMRTDAHAQGMSATVQSERLLSLLFGSGATSTSPPTLPKPLQPFQFATICPASNKLVPLVVQTGTTNFGIDQGPYQRFAQLARIPTWPMTPGRAYTPARVLRLLLNDALIMLGEQFRGVGIGGAPMRPPGLYAWQELAAPTPRRELHALPLRLFALKNGDQAARQAFEQIRQTFQILAPGRSFEIRFEATAQHATPTASQQPSLAPVARALGADSATEQLPSLGAAVTVLILDERGRELPIVQVGAGTWEALVLAEAITNSEHHTIILDEPALNLHPTWQHVLRSQLRRTTAQIAVVTHSADLVPMGDQADLLRVVRLENERGATRAHRLPPTLDAKVSARISRVFTLSGDARALLFARAAVLVEGETELGALPGWFVAAAHHRDLKTPDELDLGFHCVGGDQHFQPVLTLLHSLGIPWALICDGAVMDTVKARRWHIFRQVCDAGASAPQLASFLATHATDDATDMTSELFEQQKQLGRERGVFTLACGWTTGAAGDDSFEVFIESVAPGRLAEAESAVGRSNVRKGRWLAENIDCPDAVADLYASLVKVLEAEESTAAV
jgi:ABC-type branched-subunit amino acid transport system ATPase component